MKVIIELNTIKDNQENRDGHPIAVNVNNIVRVIPHSAGTQIFFTSQESVKVVELYKAVIAQINALS